MKLECDKCKKDMTFNEVEHIADDFKFCFECSNKFKLALYPYVKKIAKNFIENEFVDLNL